MSEASDAPMPNATLAEIRGALWKARWYRDEWEIHNPTSSVILNCMRDVIRHFQDQEARIPLRLIGQKDGLVFRAIDALKVKRFTTDVPEFIKQAAYSLNLEVTAMRQGGKEPVFIPDHSKYNGNFPFIGAESEVPGVVKAQEKHMPDFVERDPKDQRGRGHSRHRTRDRVEWIKGKGEYEDKFYEEARKLGLSLLVTHNGHDETIEVAGANSPVGANHDSHYTIPLPSSGRQKLPESWNPKRLPFRNTTGASSSPMGPPSSAIRDKSNSLSSPNDKDIRGKVRISARLAKFDAWDEDKEEEDFLTTSLAKTPPRQRPQQRYTPVTPRKTPLFDPMLEDDLFASSRSSLMSPDAEYQGDEATFHDDNEITSIDLTGIDEMPLSPLTTRFGASGALSRTSRAWLTTRDILNCLQLHQARQGWRAMEPGDQVPKKLTLAYGDRNLVFVPRINGNHFVVAHLDRDNSKCLVYNPLERNDCDLDLEEVEVWLQRWLIAHPGMILEDGEKPTARRRACPQQQNGYDCGIFCVAIAAALIENKPIPYEIDGASLREEYGVRLGPSLLASGSLTPGSHDDPGKKLGKRLRDEDSGDNESSQAKRRLVASLSTSTDVATLGRVMGDLSVAMERKHQLGLAMDQASQCLKDAAESKASEEEEVRVSVFRAKLLETTLQEMEALHAEKLAVDGLKALAAGEPQELVSNESMACMEEPESKELSGEGPKDNVSDGKQPAPEEPEGSSASSQNHEMAAIQSEISFLQAAAKQIRCRNKTNTALTTFWTDRQNKAKAELEQIEDAIQNLQSQVRSLRELLGSIL